MDDCLQQLRQRFQAASVSFEVIEHAPVYTAQEVAAASGVSGYSVAKAVVLMVDGRPHLCVLPAAETVEYRALQSVLGATEVRLAREAEFSHLFPGCTEGVIPPLRMTEDDLPVHIDRDVTANEWILFETGSPSSAIRMRTADYLRVAQGQLMDFAEGQQRIGGHRRRPARIHWSAWLRRGAAASGALLLLIIGPRVVGRMLPNRTTRSFAAGATVGVTAAALADPRTGARRRAVLRDRTGRTVRRTARTVAKRGRYMRGKFEGARHDMRHMREMWSSWRLSVSNRE